MQPESWASSMASAFSAVLVNVRHICDGSSSFPNSVAFNGYSRHLLRRYILPLFPSSPAVAAVLYCDIHLTRHNWLCWVSSTVYCPLSTVYCPPSTVRSRHASG